MVLGFSEMPDDDQPPESMWLDDEALVDHFESIKQKYRDKSNGTESVPDGVQNELTKGIRRR